MDFGFKKGQGATEYLVFLAVVLIVAMVAIALLGFFPGLAGDAKQTQSDAYWRGEARPFAILEHSMNTSGNLTLILQNVDADQRKLTAINIGGSGASKEHNVSSTNQYFSAGEKRSIAIATDLNCTAGNTYELWVNFTYSNADATITGQKQYGAKTLVGKCT